MTPVEMYFLTHFTDFPYLHTVYPLIVHRRELIRRARGVSLGLTETAAFWMWRQSKEPKGSTAAAWIPLWNPPPTNDEVLMWWDRFVAEIEFNRAEFLAIPKSERVGEIPVWNEETSAKMLNDYGFEALPEDTNK